MLSVDVGTSLGAWGDWLWGSWRVRYWYCLRITDAYGDERWLGPRRLTEGEATDWQVDEIENNWGKTVRRYVWNGQYWVYG